MYLVHILQLIYGIILKCWDYNDFYRSSLLLRNLLVITVLIIDSLASPFLLSWHAYPYNQQYCNLVTVLICLLLGYLTVFVLHCTWHEETRRHPGECFSVPRRDERHYEQELCRCQRLHYLRVTFPVQRVRQAHNPIRYVEAKVASCSCWPYMYMNQLDPTRSSYN